MTPEMTHTMTFEQHDEGAKLIRLACSLADYAPWRQSPDMDALKSAVADYRAAHTPPQGERHDNGYDPNCPMCASHTTPAPCAAHDPRVALSSDGRTVVYQSAALERQGEARGFTREDVDELRHWADVLERSHREKQNGVDTLSLIIEPRIRWLRSLAGRIAALLPPREGEG